MGTAPSSTISDDPLKSRPGFGGGRRKPASFSAQMPMCFDQRTAYSLTDWPSDDGALHAGVGKTGLDMSVIRWIYLLLAILGAIVPMFYFVSWFQANGFDLGAMVDAWNVNDAATGLVWDLTISYAALVVWVLWETIGNRKWLNLLAIPAGICIGVSFGLPLYLWLRSRPN